MKHGNVLHAIDRSFYRFECVRFFNLSGKSRVQLQRAFHMTKLFKDLTLFKRNVLLCFNKYLKKKKWFA